MEAEEKPKSGKSIFFHVTSCSTDGRVALNARQACAIESAAIWNPNRDVFVLFASPVGFAPNEPISPIIAALQSYQNVYFRNINLYTYSEGTPAGDWIKNDKIFSSEYLVSHMSDYLRYLTLYKFGGIYLDLDLVVQTNFDELPPNFAGAETEIAVAVGAIGFEADEVGHRIVEMVVRENTKKFQPRAWGYNGPGAITRVLQKICHQLVIPYFSPETCWGFKVFPPNAFYAIPWREWEKYFDTNPENLSKTLDAVKDSIAVHTWNKVSSKRKIHKKQKRTVYGFLAENNCPKAYASSGLYF